MEDWGVPDSAGCNCPEYIPLVPGDRIPENKVWCSDGGLDGHFEYLVEKPIECNCFADYRKAEFEEEKCSCVYKKEEMKLWSTVRPPGDVDELIFIQKMQKLMKSHLIKSGFLCFEWKHNEQPNLGIHAHLWLVGEIRRLKYHIKRSCKGWNVKNQKVPGEWLDDKLNYCRGITWDDAKDKEKRVLDCARRKILNIENIEFKNLVTFE